MIPYHFLPQLTSEELLDLPYLPKPENGEGEKEKEGHEEKDRWSATCVESTIYFPVLVCLTISNRLHKCLPNPVSMVYLLPSIAYNLLQKWY